VSMVVKGSGVGAPEDGRVVGGGGQGAAYAVGPGGGSREESK